MTTIELAQDFGDGRAIGEKHYRAWVGPPDRYDKIGALQFNMLTRFGLREHHSFLDIGCGSLRGGRLAIIYLRPGCYYGIDPNAWVIRDGLKAHLGDELTQVKKPTFSYDSEFTLSTFGRTFDFLLCHSVFAHAPARLIRRAMHEATKVMTNSSVFLATYIESDQDHEGDDWVYPSVTAYTPGFITATVEDAGLRCTHLAMDHPFDQRWFAVTTRSNEADLLELSRGSEFRYETDLQEDLELLTGEKRPPFSAFLLEAIDKAAKRASQDPPQATDLSQRE